MEWGDLDGGQVFALDAVLGHVAGERVGELLDGADESVGSLHQVQATDGSRRAGASAADADVGVAVHGAEDGDHVAHAGLDGADGQAHQGLGGGAAAGAVHIEVGPDAQVVLDGRGGRGVAAVVAEHPVHLVGSEAGVVDGVADSLGAQGAGGAARGAAVFGFADADDAILIAWIACHNLGSLR